MKLADIKIRIIQAYFVAEGAGISEELIIEQYVPKLFESIESKFPQDSIEDFKDFDDATLAYRYLNKEDLSVAYVIDESTSDAIYMVVRSGRKFSSCNLTSPQKTIRPCTLREVREALLQVQDASDSITFKVKSVRVKL